MGADEPVTGPVAAVIAGTAKAPTGLPSMSSGLIQSILLKPTARLIVILGEHFAGKTTLQASLWGRFCKHPYSGYRFAGSESLAAWDRVEFEGTSRSGRHSATTVRTQSKWNPDVLHLRLHRISDGAERELVMPDISGEILDHARKREVDAKRLSFITRAERVLLLVNAVTLQKPARREVLLTRSNALLRRLHEAKVLGSDVPVDLVATKVDALADTERDSISAFMASLRDNVRAWRDRTSEVFLVAARPAPGRRMDHCHGMETFMDRWCEMLARPDIGHRASHSAPHMSELDRFKALEP